MEVGPTLMGLKQESVVEIGDRQVTVVSEVLMDPEALIMTSVLDGAAVLRKSHVAIPGAAVVDFQSRGPAALVPTLHAHHLGYLRRLLSSDEEREPPGQVAQGTLATLVIGPLGEVQSRAGEDQVPGSWLRAAFLISGMSELVSTALDLGAPTQSVALGTSVSAVLTRGEGCTRVRFESQDALSEPSAARARGHGGRLA